MMFELRKDAKILHLWWMSTLLENCPKNVKEQMLMRLDEIGEKYENIKAVVVSHATNKTEDARGEKKDTQVPMEVDHVTCTEPEEEDWGVVAGCEGYRRGTTG